MGFSFQRAHLDGAAPGASVAELVANLGAAAPEGEGAKLIVTFASPKQDLAALTAAASAAHPGAVVVGASSAGEFTEAGDARGSAAAVAIGGDIKVFAGMGRGLSRGPQRAVAEALEGLPRVVPGYPHALALLLVDALAGNGEEAALLVSDALGDGFVLAGGAAGDDLAMKAAPVALGGAAEADALVVVTLFSKEPVGIGVAHGHRPLSPPMRVTRAEGNVVFEVDGKPAWTVWREAVRTSAAAAGYDVDNLTGEQCGALLLRYEAGISTGDAYKIRAPLRIEAGGALRFASAVPEGTELQITESEDSRQVESAVRAAETARRALGGAPIAGALVFDCVCRRLILQRRFREAIGGMSAALGGAPLAGFETYGEIALGPDDMSGFHNTTSVVVAFPGRP